MSVLDRFRQIWNSISINLNNQNDRKRRYGFLNYDFKKYKIANFNCIIPELSHCRTL